PSVFGQAKTLAATVTTVAPGAGTPTGTVTFSAGQTQLGVATLSGGVATLTTTVLPTGSISIDATYSGDDERDGCLGGGAVGVNKAATATALDSAPDPSVLGQTTTLTATVTAVAPGAGVPTGTVEFFEGTTSLGTGTLAAGVATL